MTKTDELMHYGILGMKWGVRRYQNADGSLTAEGKKRYALDSIPRSTRRDAKKDAKEYATAKMYYGEGAGTRRKQINAVVNQRSKDEAYKKAFDYYYEQQDMAKAGAKARSQRRTRDVAQKTTKTARGLINIANGNSQAASALALSIASAAYLAHKTGADKVVAKYARMAVNSIIDKSRIPKFR